MAVYRVPRSSRSSRERSRITRGRAASGPAAVGCMRLLGGRLQRSEGCVQIVECLVVLPTKAQQRLYVASQTVYQSTDPLRIIGRRRRNYDSRPPDTLGQYLSKSDVLTDMVRT